MLKKFLISGAIKKLSTPANRKRMIRAAERFAKNASKRYGVKIPKKISVSY